MPNQSLFVFTEGNERVHLGEFTQYTPFMTAEFEVIPETEPEKSPEAEALQRNVVSQFQQIVTSSPTLSDDLQTIAINIEEPGRLADFIAASLPFLTTTDKQELLETPVVTARLERINKHLAKEIEVQQLRNKIQNEVQDSVQQSQRDYYLREQLKAIQKELGDVDESQKDIAELKEKIEAAGMPEEMKKDALKELSRSEPDEPDGGGLQPDAELRRVAGGAAVVEELRRRRGRHQEGQGDSGCGPLRPEEGEGPHSGLPRSAAFEAGYEGADPVLRRASGRGQDLAWPVDCAGAGTQVLAHLAGRYAR